MPGCLFEVKFAAEKLDEIRIAVVEGFYAVPRGGIEIGGVLFGTRDGGVIYVEDYRIIPCEHKSGPSFLLSDRDRAGLAVLIAEGPGEPLGWFLSHTRSDVFLSPADLETHEKFFPEAWQVAMVLRPGNMQPLRAGYFFRDAAGKMCGEKACREFVVEPAFRPERKRRPVTMKAAVSEKRVEKPVQKLRPAAPVAVALAAEPDSHAAPTVVEQAVPFASYPGIDPKAATRPGWKYVWIAAAFAALALTSAAFVTRAVWMPAPSGAATLHLQASDVEGKLLLRWNAARLQDAKAGELTVEDGGKETVIPLDPMQVSRGFYLYPRKSDMTIVHMRTGASRDVTTFTGPLPRNGPTPEEIERAKQPAKVKEDLQNQTIRNRQLQKKVKELSKKLEAQTP